jgi:DNA-binding NarL/FixJ family response regulator
MEWQGPAEVSLVAEGQLIRVMAVDDHPLMMAGISGEINAQPDMRVVAEASDGDQALALFRIHRPDITLMDIRMPHVDGIAAILAIRQEFPGARIVVLTTAAGDMLALRAFKAGAVGYLLKNLLRKELTETIRQVHRGHKRIPPEIAQQIAEHAADDGITARELDVLRCVAKGSSNKIIASMLNISEQTVKHHVTSILSKLDASDRTHAVIIALQRGLLEM